MAQKGKRLKFVHITKNAGTTIEEIGRPDWGRYDKEYRDAVSDVYGLPWDHWHIPPQFMARDYLSTFKKKYDFFCVVRNPFDRVVSEYYCEWGGPKQKQDSIDLVNRWIRSRLETLRRDMAAFEDNQRRSGGRLGSYPVLEGHWIPQHLYLFDAAGARLIPPDNVLSFERLADDFDALMRRYAYPEAHSMRGAKHMNRRRQNKAFGAHSLSRDNVALIRDIYARDFELFGYPLDVPDEPEPEPEAERPKETQTQTQTHTVSGDGPNIAPKPEPMPERAPGPEFKRPRVEHGTQGGGGGSGPPKAQSLAELLAAYKTKK